MTDPIAKWQFSVWFDGGEQWAARGVRSNPGLVVNGWGCTPLTALMEAEAAARKVQKRQRS